jgi:hypothetical protein
MATLEFLSGFRSKPGNAQNCLARCGAQSTFSLLDKCRDLIKLIKHDLTGKQGYSMADNRPRVQTSFHRPFTGSAYFYGKLMPEKDCL